MKKHQIITAIAIALFIAIIIFSDSAGHSAEENFKCAKAKLEVMSEEPISFTKNPTKNEKIDALDWYIVDGIFSKGGSFYEYSCNISYEDDSCITSCEIIK